MESKRKIENLEASAVSAKIKKLPGASIQELQNFCLRFPNLAEGIFENLENQSLVRCKEVTRDWNDFFRGPPKLILSRKIQKIVETRRKFRKPWRMVVKKANVPTMMALETAASIFYADDRNFCTDPDFLEPGLEIDSESNCIAPIHVAAGAGNISLWETLIDMVEDIQPKDEVGQTPFHYAASFGHLHICENIMDHAEDKNPRDEQDRTPLPAAE